MALLWIDGFEGYGETPGNTPAPAGILARKYRNVSGETVMDIETGRYAGYCLELNGLNDFISTPALTTDDTLIAGVAIKFSNAANVFIMMFTNHFVSGTNFGMNVRLINSLDTIEVRRDATLLGSVSSLGLSSGTWYYFEFKVKCNDTTGNYYVYLDGDLILSDTDVDTKRSSLDYYDSVRLDSWAYGNYPQYDDFYICDGSGIRNNGVLGVSRVSAFYPSGDDTTEWDVNPGPNHVAAINEIEIDDSTSYIEDDTTNNTDLFTYVDIPTGLGAIKGIQINTHCQETEAQNFSLITVIESNSTEYDDAGQVINTPDWITKWRIAETDPDTGDYWSETDLNAAKFGVKVG